MNTKELFINWIEKNKLKKTTPIELAKLMEDVFHSCLDLDVWSIDDYKTYSDLRNKIILDKAFKKKNKKAYKIFVAESKHYQTYLKTELISKKDNYFNNQSIIEENDYVNSDSDSVSVFELDNKDKKILNDFFENIDITKAFYSFYLKALEQNENIQLDVRVTIAGVKVDGERLRFYSDKNGLLRFSKINKTYELADGNFDFDDICQSIKEVNHYFEVNSEDVKLQDSENDQNKYVHHIAFGFGVVVSSSILVFCTGKYVSYLDIINFHDFPNTRFPWNKYLLEGYLFLNSKKFGILNAAFNKKKPVGAIVKKHAFENFDELLIEVIRDNKLFNKDKAFEYLQENDFILTKKVKNIDLYSILKRTSLRSLLDASALRKRKLSLMATALASLLVSSMMTMVLKWA